MQVISEYHAIMVLVQCNHLGRMILALGFCTCLLRSYAPALDVVRSFCFQFTCTRFIRQNVLDYSASCTISFRSKESYFRLCILSLGYGNLYSVSSLSILRITALLVFLCRAVISLGSLKNVGFVSMKSYNIQQHQSAYLLATQITGLLLNGVNIRYVLSLCSSKIRLMNTLGSENTRPVVSLAARGFSLILLGRLKTHQATHANRSCGGQYALSVGEYKSSLILDLAYEACITSLGVLGVKVGIVC